MLPRYTVSFYGRFVIGRPSAVCTFHHPSGGLLFAIGAEGPIAIKFRASSPHKWPRMVRMLLQPLTLFIAVNNHTSLHISMSTYSSSARHTVLGEGDFCLLPPAADTHLPIRFALSRPGPGRRSYRSEAGATPSKPLPGRRPRLWCRRLLGTLHVEWWLMFRVAN